ncbi:hypothetical protein Godav_004693 [Gossypium davidsonii]|uniref:Uncharacterized protein n=1 Tax=Gossypium davidsonii TaxID=34287 RepID=A0A7J8SMS4_GOSDV|nr:hypothetical protein [Gossypium davidsonii]
MVAQSCKVTRAHRQIQELMTSLAIMSLHVSVEYPVTYNCTYISFSEWGHILEDEISQKVINFATMVTTRLSLWKPLQGASIKSIGDAELYLIHFSHMIDMEEIIFGGTWPPYSSAFKRGKYEGCGILAHRFLGSCTRLAAEDCFRKSSEESRECNGKILRF